MREENIRNLQTLLTKRQKIEPGTGQADDLILLHLGTRPLRASEDLRSCMEIVYVCTGKIPCLVGRTELCLSDGELLFLKPGTRCQEPAAARGHVPAMRSLRPVAHSQIPDVHTQILTAHAQAQDGQQNVVASFLILPELFTEILAVVGDREDPIRLFLMDCLFGQNAGPDYLCFRVADCTQIQNLAENLLLTQLGRDDDFRRISQMTLSLLFLELLKHTGHLVRDRQEPLIPRILRYIDSNYVNGQLTDAARLLNYDISILSREIRRQTGKTFTELIQKKRMSQAAALLRTTGLTVEDISRSVGYENVSYFHKLFRSAFGMSPRQYRITGKGGPSGG